MSTCVAVVEEIVDVGTDGAKFVWNTLVYSWEKGVVETVGDYSVIVREQYVALIRNSRGRRLEITGDLQHVIAAYVAMAKPLEEEQIAKFYDLAQSIYFFERGGSAPDRSHPSTKVSW